MGYYDSVDYPVWDTTTLTTKYYGYPYRTIIETNVRVVRDLMSFVVSQ